VRAGLATANPNLFVGVCLVLIVIAGVLFYRYVESPMLRAFKRRRPRAAPGAAAGAAVR
jgi:peptidoglycan/LPS O-acetylase OafA/YrhL